MVYNQHMQSSSSSTTNREKEAAEGQVTKMNTNYTLFDSFHIIRTPRDKLPSVVHYNVCIKLPPHLTSDGVWVHHNNGGSSFDSPFTIFQLQIITIFAITQCFHFLLKHLGIPYFISSVMAGFVLGPTIKNNALDQYKQMLFPFGSEDTLGLISGFGYTLYMFLSYAQMDFSMITRTGKRAWAIALSSLIPIAIGYATLSPPFHPFWNHTLGNETETIGLPAVFISHCICSFPAIAGLLNELEILNSEIGRLALSSALLLDVTGIIATAIGTAIITASDDVMRSKSFIVNLIALFIIITLVLVVGRPSMKWVVRHTPEGRPIKKIVFYVIIFFVIFIGLAFKQYNQPFFGGAVMLGLAVPEGPPLGSDLVHKLELFSTWFLMPIFLTSRIIKVDLTKCNNTKLLLVIACFIVAVTLIKLLLCVGICRFCSMPTIDSICIALILSCKGVVDVCTYVFLYDAQRYNDLTVGVMVISALILASISKIGVKCLYDPSRKYAGYQKRNILYLKPNTELRVVACIYKPCHITPIRNALELFSPTTSNPVIVDVLHLIELVGRTSPIFISHRDQHNVGASHHNFSGEVIVTFSLFEHDYVGAATVNTYTAISPFTFMHDDICYLAMDKIASFIILPFHVRWRDDGSVETEDNNIRSLNSKVMEKAPCSIGILVNRGSSGYNSSSYLLAVIFLGGPDDREALCLAKRSAKETSNSLFVYRLVGKDADSTNWDTMLDAEVLRDVQGSYGRVENVTYEEVTIEDASQTTSFLNDVAIKFDFIIAGRRNGVKSSLTDALVNWTEFSELGVIGDLLASPDMETKASILVVQQQQMPKW